MQKPCNETCKDTCQDNLKDFCKDTCKDTCKHLAKTLKQKRGTAIGTKFAPPSSILFMAELEKEIIKESEYKPYLWWRYIENIFFLWEHGENKLKSFIDKINKVNPIIKFTAEWSKTSINFLDVTVSPSV